MQKLSLPGKRGARAAGLRAHAVPTFDDNPVFELAPDAAARGVIPVAWFDTPKPLRSGWAWGEARLQGHASAFEATIGRGRLYASGSDITFRDGDRVPSEATSSIGHR